MMKDIKLIIFDLYGTLLDAYPAIISSFNYTMHKLGVRTQGPLVIRRAVGRGDEKLLEPFIKEGTLKKALFIYRKHHRQALLKGSRLFPGAKRLLTDLKQAGYKLAVASNRPDEFSRILLRHLKIDKYFDYVLCADKLKNRKPHPEILYKIRRKFSLTPQEIIYVGDMLIYLKAGLRAKVRTVAVTTGSNTRQELKMAKPYRIIAAIRDLRKLLAQV